VLNLLFIIGLTMAPPTAWNGTSAYTSSYTTTKLAPVIPSFLLIPAIIVLAVSIYYYASESNKIFGLTGIAFTTIYAVVGGSNYFIQMTTVRQNILSGETSSLALFIFDNPHSVALAIDTLGYFFLSLAVLFMAPIFSHGRTEAGVRWLFIATGVLGILGTVGFAIDNTVLGLGTLLSGMPFLLATLLLIVVFWRARQPSNSTEG
jgi:hypothetical protein